MFDEKTKQLVADPNPVKKPKVPKPKLGDAWELVSSVEGQMSFIVAGGRGLDNDSTENWEAYGMIGQYYVMLPGDTDLRKLYDQPHPLHWIYSKELGWHEPEAAVSKLAATEPVLPRRKP